MFKKSQYSFDLKLNDGSGNILCNLLYGTKGIIPNEEYDLWDLYQNEYITGSELGSDILIANRIYVDSEVDESQQVIVAKKNAIEKLNKTLTLTIKPTIACNLRCIYCWEKEENGIMSDETIAQTLAFIERKIRSSDIERVVIIWFGGEPMLAYETIIKMMQDLGKICKENSIPYVGMMSTNGTLLTAERLIELLKCHVYSYQITIDGTRDLHDSCRPFKDARKGSSYETITRNLLDIKENVRQQYFEIIYRANVTKQFWDTKDEFIEIYKNLFGDDKRFSLLLEDVTDKGGERIDEVKDSIINTARTRDHLVNELLSSDIIQHGFMNFAHGSMMCNTLLDNSYNVNHDGMCYYCELLSDGANTNVHNNRGHVSKLGYTQHDNDGVTWFSDAPELVECNDCKLYPICFGGLCPLARKRIKECRYKNNLETIYNSLCMLAKDELLPVWKIYKGV